VRRFIGGGKPRGWKTTREESEPCSFLERRSLREIRGHVHVPGTLLSGKLEPVHVPGTILLSGVEATGWKATGVESHGEESNPIFRSRNDVSLGKNQNHVTFLEHCYIKGRIRTMLEQYFSRNLKPRGGWVESHGVKATGKNQNHVHVPGTTFLSGKNQRTMFTFWNDASREESEPCSQTCFSRGRQKRKPCSRSWNDASLRGGKPRGGGRARGWKKPQLLAVYPSTLASCVLLIAVKTKYLILVISPQVRGAPFSPPHTGVNQFVEVKKRNQKNARRKINPIQGSFYFA
jgi:hypothetical protein